MSIIAMLGPATFSEEACTCFTQYVQQEVDCVYCSDIGNIFDALQSDRVDYGVIPIENTFEGSVHAHMDRLIACCASDERLMICAEWSYPIRFHAIGAPLGGEPPPWHRVQEVYSHPVAFSQCKTFLQTNIAHARCIDVSSTAIGVHKAQSGADRYGAIALGTTAAAQRWQQDIWQTNVHDGDCNATRFWLIGKRRFSIHAERLPSKSTVVIEPVADVPGALHQVLSAFAWRKLNLTKIESRPTKRQLGTYIFVLDVAARAEDVAYALDELRAMGCAVSSLGSYPLYPLLGG